MWMNLIEKDRKWPSKMENQTKAKDLDTFLLNLKKCFKNLSYNYISQLAKCQTTEQHSAKINFWFVVMFYVETAVFVILPSLVISIG